MRPSLLALAATLALPLQSPSSAQIPAAIDLEALHPITGSWSYQAAPGGSFAAFADSSRTQRLIIRCNRASRIVSIVRTGVPAAAPTLLVWTSSSARSVPARFDATRNLTADLTATDPLLDSVAFSRGRFATAAAGAPMVALPTSAEPARVVEDCRS